MANTHQVGHDIDGKPGGLRNSLKLASQLTAAIKDAVPGDLITLAEGGYSVNPSNISGLGFHGVGHRDKVILYAEPLTFTGTASVRNCTLQYWRYNNSARAVSVVGAGSHLTVQNVVITRASGDKGSAMIGRAAAGLAKLANIPDVHVGPGTTLHADASSLGTVLVDGGAFYYTGTVAVDDVKCVNGGVAGPIATNATIPPQSVPVPVLAPQPLAQTPMPPAEVRQSRRKPFEQVSNRFQQLVRSAEGAGAPVVGPNPARRPNIPANAVLWPLSQAHDWEELCPNIQDGTVVSLDEGEYWITGSEYNDLTFVGCGDNRRTILHITGNPLHVGAGRSLTLANLTLRPEFECHAIWMKSGRELTLDNVIIEHTRGPSQEPVPSIVLGSGRTIITSCEVRAEKLLGLQDGDTDPVGDVSFRGTIFVMDGAELQASNSAIGWVFCSRASIVATNCHGYAVWGVREARVNLVSGFTLLDRGASSMHAVRAASGAHVQADNMTSHLHRTKVQAVTSSTVEIGHLELPTNGTATVDCEQRSTANVGGDRNRIKSVGSSRSEDSIESLEELFAELNAMVGIEPVKVWVRSLADRLDFDRRAGTGDAKQNLHMVFTGNPGTGKTTVARLVGKILYRLGALPTANYNEVDRSKIVSKFIGETDEHVRKLIDQSMGGVLFVDEAYTLVKERTGTTDPGEDAIEVLLAALENHRGEFVAIFAGYTAEMNSFLDANPGLRSRLRESNRIEFPDYSPAEIGRITADILRADGWLFDEPRTRDAAARKYFSLPESERGNARSARNFAEAISESQKVYAMAARVPNEHMRSIPIEIVHRALFG